MKWYIILQIILEIMKILKSKEKDEGLTGEDIDEIVNGAKFAMKSPVPNIKEIMAEMEDLLA